LLAAVVQARTTVQVLAGDAPAVATSVGATTWTTFPSSPRNGQPLSSFGAHRAYRWLGGPGSGDLGFAAWAGGDGPPSGWSRTTEGRARTPHGLVQERSDPTGQVRSTIFDQGERFPVAGFTSASLSGQEGYYYGFQAYESAGGWALDPSATPIV